MENHLRGYRRTLVVAAAWLVALGVVVASGPAASGAEAPDPGLGNAYAQGVKVDPRSGRLSFGITYGMALAGHQNNVAVAESRSADLGVIGLTLAGEGCDGGDPTLPREDQPQPLVVRSTDEGSDTPHVETENGVEKRAIATSEPFARAVARTAAAGQDGLVAIGATTSETVSGIVDGARVATAVTTVDDIHLAGGVVVLRGLRWEASYQTAPTELVAGSFTMSGVEIAGVDLPIPADDPLAPLAQANAALAPAGLRIDPPVVRHEAGIQFVDPMRVSVVPSETREGLLAPVFNALAPFRESIFDLLIAADCGNAAYLTVLDVVLGSITGAGSLGLEIGGVTASSKALERSSFLTPLPGAAPSVPPPPVTGGPSTAGASPVPITPGSVASSAVPALAPPAVEIPATSSVADVAPAGGSGHALLTIGLGGLAAMLAFADADRRRLRRAARFVGGGI